MLVLLPWLTALRLAAGEAVAPRATDDVRRLGPSTAPLVVDIYIDVHCPHCGQLYSSLLWAMRPEVVGDRAETVIRWYVHPRVASSRDLITHLLAAGNRKQFGLMSRLLVGVPSGSDWKAQRERVGEVVDPAPVEQRLAMIGNEIDAVLQDDAQHWNALNSKHLPTVLITRRNGSEIQRWSGEEVIPDAIVGYVLSIDHADPNSATTASP